MRTEHIIGLSESQFDELAACLKDRIDWDKKTGRPRSLSLEDAARIALLYARQNITQEVLAFMYKISQPEVSVLIALLEPHIEAALAGYVPDAATALGKEQVLIDGTLLPCWSFTEAPELWSGKHKTTGHNVQVATAVDGTVVAVSDPYPGSWHDMHSYTEAGWAGYLGPEGGYGDKGYEGSSLDTPTKKPPNGELTDEQKEENKQINAVRSPVEHAMAHIKAWRIFHTDFRRPLRTFPQAFRTTLALYFYSVAT